MANAGLMADLRSQLLVLWQLRRRALDELLEPLLAAGSSAATPILTNLSEVIAAADSERAAFEAFLAAHELSDEPDVGGLPPGLEDDDLTEARQRVSDASEQARRLGHPSLAGTPVAGPAGATPTAPTPTATIHRLVPREPGPEGSSDST